MNLWYTTALRFEELIKIWLNELKCISVLLNCSNFDKKISDCFRHGKTRSPFGSWRLKRNKLNRSYRQQRWLNLFLILLEETQQKMKPGIFWHFGSHTRKWPSSLNHWGNKRNRQELPRATKNHCEQQELPETNRNYYEMHWNTRNHKKTKITPHH